MKRSGIADLPLHGGRVPPWLAERMTQLGTAVVEHIIHSYGTSEFLARLSDPFWFQALGCVMGMDWHSSGITTSVMGALKRGLNPRFSELGLEICGGRGRHSVRTPDELREFGGRTGLDGNELARSSRLTARYRRRISTLSAFFRDSQVGRVVCRAAGNESGKSLGEALSLALDQRARLRV